MTGNTMIIREFHGSESFPGTARDKEPTCQCRRPETLEICVLSLGQEDPLEEGRRIPWTEEPGGLQSIESQRVRHD